MINIVSENVINERNGGAAFSLTYSSRPINARKKRIGIHEINKCVDLMIMVVFQKVNVEITHSIINHSGIFFWLLFLSVLTYWSGYYFIYFI